MADNRDTHEAGAPVHESPASDDDVLAAVERAQEPAPVPEPSPDAPAAADATVAANAESEARVGDESADHDPVPPAAADNQPIDSESADAAPSSTIAAGLTKPQTYDTVGLDTQPHVETPPTSSSEIGMPDTLPPLEDQATVAAAAPAPSADRGNDIRISPDHPMAALYMQSPMPPEIRGNRGAGVGIAILATIVFALLYAGVISLRLAIEFPPSTFLTDGLLPFLTSWGFIAATAAYFVGLVLLVLIVGRAGWWAYVLGGLLVAAFVWAAAVLGYAFAPEVLGGVRESWDLRTIVTDFGMVVPTLGAALVAREVTVWFGAWIGARGRRVSARNQVALEEYETALQEVRAQQAS